MLALTSNRAASMAQANTAILSSGVKRMLGLGLEDWNDVLVISLILASIAAGAVCGATYCVVQLQRAENAAAKMELEGYKLSVAKEISAANEETAKAKLELGQLQQKIAPRRILEADFLKSIEGDLKPTVPIEILYARDDPDSAQLASQLFRLLHFDAKWPVEHERPIPAADASSYFSSALSVGGNSSGVTIVENPGGQDRTVGGVLKVALLRSLGTVVWSSKPDMPVGAVRIVVAPKL